MNIEQLIRQSLQEEKMLRLATAAGDQPWICNVWFGIDEELNLYWFSTEGRRHSKEVATNPKVAATVCKPQTPDDIPRAVQIEGLARKLTTETDIAKARSVYENRIFPSEKIDQLMQNPDWPHYFYRLEPTLFVLFDAVNFPDVSRQEWRPGAEAK